MPLHATTVLFVFVLASCFYKKHVRDWGLFRLGILLFVGSIVVSTLGGLLPGPRAFGGAGSWISGGIALLAQLAEIGAFGAMVLGCLKKAELDAGLRCPDCGYTLKGLGEPRCPECGFVI